MPPKARIRQEKLEAAKYGSTLGRALPNRCARKPNLQKQRRSRGPSGLTDGRSPMSLTRELESAEPESQGMKVADGSSDDPHVSEAVTGLSSRGGAKRTKSTAKTPTVMKIRTKTAMKTAMKTGPGKPARKPKGWSAGVTFVPHPPGWKPPVLRQARLAEFEFLKKGSGEGATAD